MNNDYLDSEADRKKKNQKERKNQTQLQSFPRAIALSGRKG